jgi:hypothetical protein
MMQIRNGCIPPVASKADSPALGSAGTSPIVAGIKEVPPPSLWMPSASSISLRLE